MFFLEKIENLCRNDEYIIYVDMDGVIASYDFGSPLNFRDKRPLINNINLLKEVNKLNNVELKILSICHINSQIEEKNEWLDKYAPFFKKENRIILSKETHKNIESPDLKANYLNSVKSDKKIILIDDDNQVLKTVHKKVNGVICIQDSELID